MTYGSFANVLVALLLATGCGDDATSGTTSGTTSGNGNQGSAGAGNNSGTGASSSGGTASGGGAASGSGATASGGTGGDETWTPFPLCVQICDQPADCATAGSPQVDANNYSCDDGYCEYLGCQNNAECQSISQDWVCDEAAFGLPTCVRTCSTPNDCVIGADPRYDADNYECNDSKCAWLGCQSNAECRGLGLGDAWECADGLGNVPNCVRTCDAPSECAFTTDARYDADNYACEDSLCEYVGCNNNTECEAGGSDWECVER